MTKTKIQIAYDGKALADGSMDVRELAPALLALGAVLEEANQTLNGDKAKLMVKVQSDFKTGSFEIVLELLQNLAQQVTMMFEHEKVWSAEDIATFVGLTASSGIGLLKLIKWLRGRKVKSTTTIENGLMRIETNGEYDSIEVRPEVIKLAKNQRLRTQMSAVLRPLSKKAGISFFYTKANGEKIETITAEDVPYFAPPEVTKEEELVNTTRKGAFNVIGPEFEEGFKWRLFDGENNITASMLDTDFLGEVGKGKTFSKGDILVLELRTKQVKTPTGGIRNEHEILEVLKHKKAQEQVPLDFGGDI